MSTGTETFTASNGAAAAAPWVTNISSGGPTWNIQTNQHRASGVVGYHGAGLTYGSVTPGLTTITCDITPPVSKQESFPGIGYRMSGGTNGWDSTFYEAYNGYDVHLDILANTVNWARLSAGSTTASDSIGFTTTGGSQYTLRIVVSGSNHQVSVWLTSGSPPGSPQLTETDATYSTGLWGIRAQQNTASTMDYDNVTWNDDIGGVAYAPNLARYLPRGRAVSRAATR